MPLRALIFDVDGTLAETEEAHRLAFNQAFAESGLDWVWDRTTYHVLLDVSGGAERLRSFINGLPPQQQPPHLDALIADLHRRKSTIYTARLKAGEFGFRPGVLRLMAEARRQGLVLAIASNTSRRGVEALLERATDEWGIAHPFAAIACGEDAPRKKPDPQVYQLVLDHLGLPAASCLAIEDSTNGVRAAISAGLAVVVSKSICTLRSDFTGARAVFDNLARVTLADLIRLHGDSRA
jgi:HAD superfamily hydrolase (TIGR01509 family)